MTDAMEARLIDEAVGKSADVYWLRDRVRIMQPGGGLVDGIIVGRSLGALLYDIAYDDGAREHNVAARRLSAIAS